MNEQVVFVQSFETLEELATAIRRASGALSSTVLQSPVDVTGVRKRSTFKVVERKLHKNAAPEWRVEIH